MKRTLLLSASLLFLPLFLNAATMGAYFDLVPAQMAYSPHGPYSFFDVYLYIHNAPYYISAIEYQLRTPGDSKSHDNFKIAEIELSPYAAVDIGTPFNGQSIAFFPPLNGFETGYNMVCRLTCYTTAQCVGPVVPPPGTKQMSNYTLVIGAHPESGQLRGAYWPDNEPFAITGLTSIVCPLGIGTKETSWGGIKNLYR